MDELEKASQTANQENGLLRAQVERLQVELKEYRKRISWLSSGNGLSTISAMSNVNSRNLANLNNNDFHFDFPKFGDLPGKHMFSNSTQFKSKPKSPSTANVSPTAQVPEYPRKALSNQNLSKAARANGLVGAPVAYNRQTSTSSAASNSASPSASSDSHQGQPSSIGTSPEPSLNSPNVGKLGNQTIDFYGNESAASFGTIDGEKSFCEKLGMACGNIENPVPAVLNQNNNNTQLLGQLQPVAVDQSFSFDWLAQQNGGSFDPVLFNDYREPQDAILSQDFGGFFNEAFPLPDLGSPFGNINDDATNLKDVFAPAKQDNSSSQAQASQKEEEEEEVVPGEDKAQIMSCTNIWYVVFKPKHVQQLTNLLSGIVYKRWRNSATVKLTSTHSVQSYGPRHAAQKVAWLSIEKMWTTLLDVLGPRCRSLIKSWQKSDLYITGSAYILFPSVPFFFAGTMSIWMSCFKCLVLNVFTASTQRTDALKMEKWCDMVERFKKNTHLVLGHWIAIASFLFAHGFDALSPSPLNFTSQGARCHALSVSPVWPDGVWRIFFFFIGLSCIFGSLNIIDFTWLQ